MKCNNQLSSNIYPTVKEFCNLLTRQIIFLIESNGTMTYIQQQNKTSNQKDTDKKPSVAVNSNQTKELNMLVSTNLMYK